MSQREERNLKTAKGILRPTQIPSEENLSPKQATTD